MRRHLSFGFTPGTRLAAFALVCLAAFEMPNAAAQGERTDDTVPISLRQTGDDAWGDVALLEMNLPGEANLELQIEDGDWTDLAALRFSVEVPDGGPTNLQVLVFVADWDHFWHQRLLPGYLGAGQTNDFHVDLSPHGADQWTAYGHFSAWHHRALHKPKLVGLRIFGKQEFSTQCFVANVRGIPRHDTDPPVILGVRANTNETPCYEKFELTFTVSDRYADPFDAEAIAVEAVFTTPAGEKIRVDGFYARNFFRRIDPTGEHLVPQGPPYWQVRFAPMSPGVHTYTLTARDRLGTTSWGPGTFTATEPRTPGFVRVSKRDPRYFEFSDGTFFFPIGHNIRSPNDMRMKTNFPWTHRWEEGSASYARRFADMSAHGENFAEIWTAAWSLGLEWNGTWRGYRGVGQYNLMNAWELDRVMDEAMVQRIYIGLVLMNHGKFSTFSDPEWDSNPFNTANGGYLKTPEEYFSDPRAIQSFRKLMRYMVARWGYSSQLVTWQLWSELDLTGSSDRNSWKSPEVVDWHRLMGQEIKEMDPYDHMIATHVCGDYQRQYPPLMELPQMDYCAVDAYHSSPNPLHIVDLMRRTAVFNNPYKKPVLITEFGGSPAGQTLKHLTDSLHAAIWSATSIPVAGTPMFWWWHIIEEENLYPMFAAVSRYMHGEDRRDPASRVAFATLVNTNGTPFAGDIVCMSNGEKSHGWIFHTSAWSRIDPLGPPKTESVNVRIQNMTNGTYIAEFWETQSGTPLERVETENTDGTLRFQLPPFARDIAFKAWREP